MRGGHAWAALDWLASQPLGGVAAVHSRGCCLAQVTGPKCRRGPAQWSHLEHRLVGAAVGGSPQRGNAAGHAREGVGLGGACSGRREGGQPSSGQVRHQGFRKLGRTRGRLRWMWRHASTASSTACLNSCNPALLPKPSQAKPRSAAEPTLTGCAHGGGGRVLLVVQVQDEDDLQRLGQLRVHLVALRGHCTDGGQPLVISGSSVVSGQGTRL